MLRSDDGNRKAVQPPATAVSGPPLFEIKPEHRVALTLPKACQYIGERTGRTPATSTAWRWVLRGVRGGIKLESFCLGGQTFTTPEYITRFMDRTTSSMPSTPAPNHTPVDIDHDKRRQEIAAAQARLSELNAPKRRRKSQAP